MSDQAESQRILSWTRPLYMLISTTAITTRMTRKMMPLMCLSRGMEFHRTLTQNGLTAKSGGGVGDGGRENDSPRRTRSITKGFSGGSICTVSCADWGGRSTETAGMPVGIPRYARNDKLRRRTSFAGRSSLCGNGLADLFSE